MRRRKRADQNADSDRPDIWQRLSRLLLALVFLLVMAGILSLFWPEIDRQRQLDGDLAKLTDLRDLTLAHRNRLVAKLEWMRTDSEYFETIARDRLDLHKKGEYIIRVEDLRPPVENAPVLAPADGPAVVRKPVVIE